MTGLLASVAMTEHLERARESAQVTYDRRRARAAADTLATILPSRWDTETRRIVATLATISSPSRIDDLLDAFDGEPADTLVQIDTPDPAWNSSQCTRRHQHATPDDAYACDMLPGAGQ